MKLIKLFEEFIAEAANPNYPVGEYDYSYVDMDFKPLGQPLKLKVTDVPALDNPTADWLIVKLIVHNQSLELYPLDPKNDSSIETARPDIFSHPAFGYADNNGKPNPWPAGTAYIKIYKKGETPQIGAEDAADPKRDELLQATYPPGTYKFHFIDKDFKPVKSGVETNYNDAPVDQQIVRVIAYNITIKQPWKAALPNRAPEYWLAELEENALAQAKPVDSGLGRPGKRTPIRIIPANRLEYMLKNPGIFKIAAEPQADLDWPEGSSSHLVETGDLQDLFGSLAYGAYIKIYKKGETVPDPDKTLGSGETPQIGAEGNFNNFTLSAKTIPELQNFMEDAFDLPVEKWNIGQKPELSFRPNLYNGRVLLSLAKGGNSKLTAINLVSNSPADHLKKQFPDKAALTQQGFKVWGEGIIRIANESETDWAIMYKL